MMATFCSSAGKGCIALSPIPHSEGAQIQFLASAVSPQMGSWCGKIVACRAVAGLGRQDCWILFRIARALSCGHTPRLNSAATSIFYVELLLCTGLVNLCFQPINKSGSWLLLCRWATECLGCAASLWRRWNVTQIHPALCPLCMKAFFH